MKSKKNSLARELSTKEVAERFDVEPRSVRNWCVRGLLPGAYELQTPRGPVWMIPETAFDGFMQPKAGQPRKHKPAEQTVPAR
jgi:hypothetical protein